MKIIPVLYLQSGKVVSFYKGHDNSEKKVYSKAAHNFAEEFQKKGAKQIFVVDLDGDQDQRLLEIREHFSGEIWWAGQIRDLESIQARFSQGADRVVLGQSAQEIHRPAIEKFGAEKVIVGLQFNDPTKAVDVCEMLSESPVDNVIIKDLNAEGTLLQPNFDLMEKCLYFSDLKVFASGGVTTERDLKLLAETGVSGVIIGRALYEHELDLAVLVNRYENV